MTDQEISLERSTRIDHCKVALEEVLKQHQFGLVAEDDWTPNTKIRVEISFVDLKKYPKADLAQPETPIVSTDATSLAAPVSGDPVPVTPESLK